MDRQRLSRFTGVVVAALRAEIGETTARAARLETAVGRMRESRARAEAALSDSRAARATRAERARRARDAASAEDDAWSG